MAAVDGVRVEAGRISAVARDVDLATPVPWLGRWKIRDVVAHLGGVHRWADRVVAQQSMDGPGFRKSTLDGDALLDWFDDGADALVRTLSAVDPSEPCPNFNPGSEKTVGWWVRRQLHETTVHRWDVERAVVEPTPIDPAVAGDGVDEFLDTFVRTRGKQQASAPLLLASTDPARSWTITLASKPGRVDVARGAGEAGTTLSGPAASLLLVLWGRLELDASDLTIEGDPAAALDFLAGV